MIKQILGVMAIATALTACAGKSADNANAAATDSVKAQTTMTNPDTTVLIKTSEGDIIVRVYGDTPKHQANFLKLVREGYYNNTLFHRVINEFMVQAGDPDSREGKPGQQLGAGGPDYTIEAEIAYPKHFHKRGALAAARQGDQVNPEKRSSGSQFYIVTGKKVSEAELTAMARQGAMQEEFNRLAQAHMQQIRAMQQSGDQQGLMALQNELVEQVNAKFANDSTAGLPKEIIDTYAKIGGTPFLDRNYTVFGEVVSGMDVVEKIEKAETDAGDRPVKDIRIISMSIIDKK